MVLRRDEDDPTVGAMEKEGRVCEVENKPKVETVVVSVHTHGPTDCLTRRSSNAFDN